MIKKTYKSLCKMYRIISFQAFLDMGEETLVGGAEISLVAKIDRGQESIALIGLSCHLVWQLNPLNEQIQHVINSNLKTRHSQ